MATKAKTIGGTARRAGGLTQTIAWQGLTAVTPDGWSLVAASGDERSGSLRLEDTNWPDGDAPLGMEARWSQVRQVQTADGLDKRVKPILDVAKKAAKKANLESETAVSGYDDKRHKERGVVREFTWRADAAGIGRVWRCETCGRLVIIQVYGKRGSRFHDRAREVMATLSCHGDEEGWTRWALYGLDVMVPSSYSLAGQQLMNIYIELRFARSGKSKRGDSITVEQWSAANVQLKGAYLDEWFERKGRHLYRTLRIDKTPSLMHGHEALSLIGKRTGISYWMGDAFKDLTAMHMPARHYCGLGWECGNANKVYMVQSLTAKRDDSVVQGIAERTRCHEASPLSDL